MKKLWMILILIITTAVLIGCCPNSSVAQSTNAPKMITVPVDDLTVDQLAKIEAEKQLAMMEDKLETYGKWVGVGGEIGTAINDGLGAVVTSAEEFGKTEVGFFTMALIAWKVAGKDLVRIGFGFVLFVVFTIMMIYMWKQFFTDRRMRTKGAWYQFWVTKEYEIKEHNDRWDGYYFVKSAWWAFLLGGYGITYAIMFGG